MKSRDTITGIESNTWGENPLGFITYTAGGRMSAILTNANRSITADSAGSASTEEQAMLFRNSFSYAGRYTITLILLPIPLGWLKIRLDLPELKEQS